MEPSMHESNGKSEVQRLTEFVRQLQAECERLREALARAELERNLYRRAVCDYERAKGEFKGLDFDQLQKMSAGPVELIEQA